MGLGGTAEYLCNLFSCRCFLRRKKRCLQTVHMKVMMDCEGCEHKVRRALSSMKGVETVETNRTLQKVTVTGFVEPKKVMKKAKKAGKRAEPWSYVPYNWLTSSTYTMEAWDNEAPPGYVRKPSTNQESEEQWLTTLFSDENPNACSVM